MSHAAQAIAAYHEAVEADRERAGYWMEWLLARESERNLEYGGKPIPTLLRPAFIDATQASRVARVVGILADALERVLQDYMTHPEVRREIPFEPGTADLLSMPTGLTRNVIVARYDAFQGPDYLRFNEFNTDSPASMAWNQVQHGLFSELPMMDEVKKRFGIAPENSGEVLVEALLGAYGDFGLNERPRLLITDWDGVSTRAEFEEVKRRFELRGIPAAIADPRAIEMQNGLAVADGFAANLIYRRVVWSELLEKLDECSGLVAALRSDSVCVANPLAAKIAGNKACMAYLSNPANRHRFTAEQWETIQEHVPWTAVLRHGPVSFEDAQVDPFDLAAACREGFVIKPLNSYGGRGVMLGDQVTETEWEERLALVEGEPDGWCLQARIPIPSETFPWITDGLGWELRNVNLNPYVLGGRYGGALTRLSKSPVINVSAGGGMVPTIVVTGPNESP